MAAASRNTTMIGVGITMEGIWQNYPAFEYTLRFAWANETPAAYISGYARRRYGPGTPAQIGEAWQTLLQIAYSGDGSFGSLVTTYPTMTRALPTWMAERIAAGRSPALLATNYAKLFEGNTASRVHDQCRFGRFIATYLAQYPPNFDPNRPPYNLLDLSAAEKWCQDAGAVCGGVTLHDGHYEVMRA
jgi:hypothetical protein